MRHRKRKVAGSIAGGRSRAVRFPAPSEHPTGKRRPPRLRDLFARHWRCVVIQGQHYWLPG